MKTFEERSPRYRRNAERVEIGLGFIIMGFLGLLLVGAAAAVIMGAATLLRGLF